MKQILFRCSSLGAIMTEPRSKSEVLSETCKTQLQEVFIREKYGRKKDVSSKYMEKGTLVEEDSITLLSLFYNTFYKKNEKNFQNDFISGTPDVILEKKVIDIKSSWDIFTFHKAKMDEINKAYDWQLQGYMALTGAEEAELVYCLVDTPDHILDGEKRSLAYKLGLGSEGDMKFKHLFDDIEKNGKYCDIMIEERVFVKKIPRCQEKIDKIYQKVELCRNFLKSEYGI
jgi:hypothetical protein